MKRVIVILVALAGIVLVVFNLGGPIDPADYVAPDLSFGDDARLSADNRPPVEFAIIKTGEARTLLAFAHSGGEFAPYVVSHTAFLVRHPRGNLLFDTGLGLDIDQQFDAEMPFWAKPLMAYQKLPAAVSQLQEHNISPDDIDVVLASHLHWDHASGIEDFPDAQVWITRDEYEWGLRVAGSKPGIMLSQFDDPDIKWRFIEFEPAPYAGFASSLDVYRDGSVVLVPLVGHTPGAFGMFVTVASGQQYFFTGDTTWSIEGFEIPADKFWVSSLLVDNDKEQARTPIAHVHQLMAVRPDLIIVPAHDNRIHAQLGFFPTFVR